MGPAAWLFELARRNRARAEMKKFDQEFRKIFKGIEPPADLAADFERKFGNPWQSERKSK